MSQSQFRTPVNAADTVVNPVFAGTGACRSCSCRGFVEGRSKYVCECGHAYNQHKVTW